MRLAPRLRTLGPVARVDMITRITLLTGLVLFAFTAGHLINHALGIHSLGAMEAGRAVSQAVWRSAPGSILLFGSLGAHATFALWRLYERRSLRLPWWETAQILTGVAIPFALTAHVLETRMFARAFEVDDGYLYMLLRGWPERAAGLSLLLALAWAHGCLGIHYWLRPRRWYAALRPLALAVAILLPVLGLIGLARGIAAAQALATDPAWLAEVASAGRWPGRFAEAVANKTELYVLTAFGAAVALAMAARTLRGALSIGRPRVRIEAGPGRATTVRAGATVLDACRKADIPLAAPCGGRGRCAGCRVRVGRGREGLEPPDDDERSLLAEVGASPEVRLACRIRPLLDIQVTPLLAPSIGAAASATPRPYLQGRQQTLAVLAAAPPALPGNAPPGDVVSEVNDRLRLFDRASRAMGGVADPAFHSSLIALFGLHTGASSGTAAGVAAAFQILSAADADGARMPVLALHTGPAIVAELGHADPAAPSAVGVAVRVARTLVEAGRDYGCQIVLSEEARAAGGFALSGFPRRMVPIRGWREPIMVHVVMDYRELAATIVAQAGQPPPAAARRRGRGPRAAG